MPPEPPEPKVEPRYKQGTVLLITSEGYSYLARVTADALPDATKVRVHVFNADIRDTLGGTVALEAVKTTREEPPEGWGTRKVALEYFDGTSWDIYNGCPRSRGLLYPHRRGKWDTPHRIRKRPIFIPNPSEEWRNRVKKIREVKNRTVCKHRILRIGYCLIVLGLTGLLCIMPACQPSADKDGNTEKPDTDDGTETPPPDTEEEAETPPPEEETPPPDTEEEVETPPPDVEDDKPPPEEDKPPPDTEEEAETPDAPLLYKADTLLLVKWDTYSYLARVTADTSENATEVPIHVFNEKARNVLGSNIAIANVVTTRKKPQNGWGTRKVALEYFDGTQWQYTLKALEAVDHYTVPRGASDKQRVEFENVRFDIITK